MLSCTVHLVKRERNIIFGQGISCLVGGIFICCPLTLYIPRTFHIPLSPTIVRYNGAIVGYYGAIVEDRDTLSI
jgi:hypothetical protein